ncbi:hypothetical protein JD844_010360 [Phrynosoma platyrhinos]|uniref:Uncharacterized protein n=1 Tax=Phrynosoma platyrhinos TaxID=52577 RepID=A0ABQ7TH81_PHRPL|nr:hypothetical protein JD844_010360 [Phrynosoma platyrhinos]
MRFWRRRPMFRRSHLKILLTGNSGVGKSALMNQYVNNRFSSRYRATIGADFLSKQVHIDGRTLTVQIEPGEEPTFPIAVIGNKTDLENREVRLHMQQEGAAVSSEEAELWSRLHDATYFETSAKAATNVQEVFEWAIRAVLKNRRVPEPPEPDSVHLETRQPEGARQEKCSC